MATDKDSKRGSLEKAFRKLDPWKEFEKSQTDSWWAMNAILVVACAIVFIAFAVMSIIDFADAPAVHETSYESNPYQDAVYDLLVRYSTSSSDTVITKAEMTSLYPSSSDVAVDDASLCADWVGAEWVGNITTPILTSDDVSVPFCASPTKVPPGSVFVQNLCPLIVNFTCSSTRCSPQLILTSNTTEKHVYLQTNAVHQVSLDVSVISDLTTDVLTRNVATTASLLLTGLPQAMTTGSSVVAMICTTPMVTVVTISRDNDSPYNLVGILGGQQAVLVASFGTLLGLINKLLEKTGKENNKKVSAAPQTEETTAASS